MDERTPESEAPRKPAGMFRRLPADDLDLATDIRTTLLVQNPRGGRIIVWLILLFVVVFLAWASLSEIDEVTRGDGKVIPSQQIQVVQNLEGGILGKLHVKVGDIVDKDQLLIEIDKTRFAAPYMESRVGYLALKAQIARLEAEVRDTAFTVPEEVATEKPELGTREQELFTSRKEQLAAKLQILEEQLAQRRQELAELKSRLGELNRTYGLLNKELSMTRPLVAQGAVSEVEVLRLQRQASEMSGNIQTTKIAIPKVESKIAEAKKALEEERLIFHNTARKELNEAYGRLEGITASAVALADRLERTAVRSPGRGTINQIKVNTVGGTIQPGMDLIEIVPLEDTLLVEARIKPADIAFLHPAQQAVVKFTAYDFTIYGGLDADLEHISADSITDKQGNDYYLVRLRTALLFLGAEKPLPSIPGMVVSLVDISGEDHPHHCSSRCCACPAHGPAGALIMNLILCCAPDHPRARWLAAWRVTSSPGGRPAGPVHSRPPADRPGSALCPSAAGGCGGGGLHPPQRRPAGCSCSPTVAPDEDEARLFLRLGIVGYANGYISDVRLPRAARTVTPRRGASVNQQLMQRLIAQTVPADKAQQTAAARAASPGAPSPTGSTRSPA